MDEYLMSHNIILNRTVSGRENGEKHTNVGEMWTKVAVHVWEKIYVVAHS